MLREGSDYGRPIVVTQPESEVARAIDGVAAELARMGVRRIRLPVLNLAPKG